MASRLTPMAIAWRTAGSRKTVVVSHHPIVSGGQHGGYFDWPTYLFPFHPWARIAGLFARQDVMNAVSYLARTEAIGRIVRAVPDPDTGSAGRYEKQHPLLVDVRRLAVHEQTRTAVDLEREDGAVPVPSGEQQAQPAVELDRCRRIGSGAPERDPRSPHAARPMQRCS